MSAGTSKRHRPSYTHVNRRRVVVAAGAVAVVCLAVLAYLILAPAPPETPCNGCGGPGTSLALGMPNESTASNGSKLYSFTVDSAGGGLVWQDVGFSLQGPTGTPIPTSGANWSLSVLSPNGAAVASYSLGSTTPVWTSGGTTLVMSSQSILLVSPANDALAGQGNTFTVMGVGSFQGSITVPIP